MRLSVETLIRRPPRAVGGRFALRVHEYGGRKVVVTVIVPVRVAPKATARNQARRRVRESFRRVLPGSISGYQILVSVRGLPLPPSVELDREIFELLRKSAIVPAR